MLRTRLVRAIRNRDSQLAAELSRARGDVSLGAYGELAAGMVLARDAEDRSERLAAIHEDLTALPEADRWLRAIGAEQLQSATPIASAQPSQTPAIEA